MGGNGVGLVARELAGLKMKVGMPDDVERYAPSLATPSTTSCQVALIGEREELAKRVLEAECVTDLTLGCSAVDCFREARRFTLIS